MVNNPHQQVPVGAYQAAKKEREVPGFVFLQEAGGRGNLLGPRCVSSRLQL